jgi:hypothetical protein
MTGAERQAEDRWRMAVGLELARLADRRRHHARGWDAAAPLELVSGGERIAWVERDDLGQPLALLVRLT